MNVDFLLKITSNVKIYALDSGVIKTHILIKTQLPNMKQRVMKVYLSFENDRQTHVVCRISFIVGELLH